MISGYTKHDKSQAYDDDVQHWFSELDRGIRLRKTQDKRWDINEAFEDMRQWDDGIGGLTAGEYDEPTINKIGSYNRNYRSAISYRNPRVKMVPKNAAAWEMIKLPVMGQDGKPVIDQETGQVEVIEMTRASARETLINDIISRPDFGLRDTLSRFVKSACLGYGAVAVGYKPSFETPLEKDSDDLAPVLENGMIDFEAAFIINPLTGSPMEDDDGKPIKKNRVPSWEEWFIDWVHYRHIIIDPDGGNDFMKHRWVCIQQVRTLEEVKADPLFSNTSDLQSTSSLEQEEENRQASRRWHGDDMKVRDSSKLVRLFHIYDFVHDRRIVLADGHGKALLDEVTPLGVTHSPLVFFRPNERITDVEEFYPRPIDTDLVPLVSENNQARKMLAVARKRGLRKVLVDKGTLDPDNIDKLTNDEDMAIVELDKKSQYGLDKTVHFMSPPPIGGDIYNNLQIISADFDEVGGVGVASRGGSTNSTATETQKRARAEGARYDFDRQQLRDSLIMMFKKLDDSIDANMTIPKAISISGSAGMLHEVLMDRDMIACDCDIDIDITEMAPTDDEGDAARMIQFAQVIGQSDWMATDEAIVRTMAERVKIRDENFIKGLVKAAQEKQQREMQMLQMQLQASMQQAQMKMAQQGGPGKDGKVPNAPPPSDPGQQEMQNAAGQQAPNMQGGR